MPMYIYYKNGKIRVVSDVPAHSKELDLLYLRHSPYSPEILLKECIVKDGQVVKVDRSIDPKNCKIAFISVWDIPCGIATYSQFLVSEMKKINPNVRVFAESHKDQKEDSSEVVYCWERGKSLNKLVASVKEYDPDLVYIQHEYGIFPDARKWSQLISSLEEYKTYVTLHSVYYHKDKSVCEAICPNIIVHSEAAKGVLKEKGITVPVEVVPHGCLTYDDVSRLWNIYRSPYTVVQFGFGFEYKGWPVALEAVKILKEKYPDIFYLMLFSESSFVQEHHDVQYTKLQDIIEKEGLDENVAIIRGYQSDEALRNFLRTLRVAIFPYTSHPDHVVYGSSGAVRIALSNGIPTIVSKVPLFSDLDGIVPRVDSAEELAAEISKLFSNSNKYKEQVKKQLDFVENNKWSRVAEKYLHI